MTRRAYSVIAAVLIALGFGSIAVLMIYTNYVFDHHGDIAGSGIWIFPPYAYISWGILLAGFVIAATGLIILANLRLRKSRNK